MALGGIYAIYKYYRVFEPSGSRWEVTGFIFCIIAGEFYRYTEESPPFFFNHFHIAAAFIYLFSILMLLYFVVVGRLSSCMMSINVILFLLFKDTPSTR